MTTITIDRAVVEQALEALEAMQSYAAAERKGLRICDEAIPALRAALAHQAEAVEPVAWRTFDGEGGYDYRAYADNENYAAEWAQRNPRHVGWVEPLYIAPPQRKLVPLTEEEIMHIGMTHQSLRQVARAVERAHGIT